MSSLLSLARNVRHSDAFEAVVSAYRRMKFVVLANTSKTRFPIDLYGAMGFGASLSHLVNVLSYCDRHGLKPHVKFSNRLYASADNPRDWFENYFDSRLALSPAAGQPRTFAVIQSGKDYPFNDQLTIAEAHRLFDKYVSIKTSVQEEADAFAAEHFRGTTLGVHYRGTDKVTEAPTVEWDLVRNKILDAIKAVAEIESVFLTSDDLGFIEYIHSQGLPVVIATYDFKEVSKDGVAIHLSEGDGYQKGLEALITILLLAKCDIVIRTSSHLSAWGKILNPAQRVVMLSQPFESCRHFPDSEIWKERVNL